jgi:hypothetical protein
VGLAALIRVIVLSPRRRDCSNQHIREYVRARLHGGDGCRSALSRLDEFALFTLAWFRPLWIATFSEREALP